MTEYGTINWMFDEINGIPTLYWILILAAAIIGFIILFFIAYYIIYKIRINKALKKEKHIGKSLISPLGVAVASGAVVWIASTVFIIAMLHLLAGISYQNSEYISDNYRNIISLQQQLFLIRSLIATPLPWEKSMQNQRPQSLQLNCIPH